MDNRIEQLKKFRQFLLIQVAELTAEQLNKIPEGCSNNIIWNLAHLICAQQSLCYLRAGQPVIVDEYYISAYRTGTRPETVVSEAEIEKIKTLFISTLDQLQTDIGKKIIDRYSPSENILKVYGIHLHSLDDALGFLLYHEGFHSGAIAALKKLVV